MHFYYQNSKKTSSLTNDKVKFENKKSVNFRVYSIEHYGIYTQPLTVNLRLERYI